MLMEPCAFALPAAPGPGAAGFKRAPKDRLAEGASQVRQWHAAAGTAALVALQRRSARRGTAVSTSPIFEGSKGEEPIKVSLGERFAMNQELMDRGFDRLSSLEECGLLNQCIRISERALRRVLESADVRYRQLDMHKPKVEAILSTPGILEIFTGAGWEDHDQWLVLPEGTPLELTQYAVRGLQKELRRRETVQSTAERPEEQRFNPWDGKIYTFEELEKCLSRADLTVAEIQEHWAHRCRPLQAAVAGGPPQEPQVEAWQKVWSLGPWRRMWTSADQAHVHAVTGAVYMLLGAMVLADVAAVDLAKLNGGEALQVMPSEAAWLALAFGILNAVSGLQPSLLTARRDDVARLLGFGAQGDVKSGGFLNAAAFYMVLAYQCARAHLPELAMLDQVVGLFTMLLVAHQAFILNSWVSRGQMHRVDAFLVPGIFNLPVSLHLLDSQVWWQELCNRYATWPEFFFSANFALAWACAMVTLVLSLYERRVISLELRGMLMLALPAAVFGTVVLRAMVLLPDDKLWLLTLNP